MQPIFQIRSDKTKFIVPTFTSGVARNFDWVRGKMENFCDVILVP